jgi:hypothetical protein
VTVAKIPLPALVRSYRDGPPEQYDRDDLQVALWDAGLEIEAPKEWVHLSWFYNSFIKRPFPPLTMIAMIEQNRMGDLEIDLVNQRNRRYYEKLLEEDRGEYFDPRDSLIYLQGQAADEFLQDWASAQIRDLAGGWPIRFKISRDNFEHYFGWSNSIDMGD